MKWSTHESNSLVYHHSPGAAWHLHTISASREALDSFPPQLKSPRNCVSGFVFFLTPSPHCLKKLFGAGESPFSISCLTAFLDVHMCPKLSHLGVCALSLSLSLSLSPSLSPYVCVCLFSYFLFSQLIYSNMLD